MAEGLRPGLPFPAPLVEKWLVRPDKREDRRTGTLAQARPAQSDYGKPQLLVHQIDNPVFADSRTRIETGLATAIKIQCGVAHFDDQQGSLGMVLPIARFPRTTARSGSGADPSGRSSGL